MKGFKVKSDLGGVAQWLEYAEPAILIAWRPCPALLTCWAVNEEYKSTLSEQMDSLQFASDWEGEEEGDL